jgi:hypothetical protein
MFEKEVRKEQDKFNKLLPKLLKTNRKNQWVLFRGGKVISYHRSCLKAYKQGLKKFGCSSYFVIDQIKVHYPILVPNVTFSECLRAF